MTPKHLRTIAAAAAVALTAGAAAPAALAESSTLGERYLYNNTPNYKAPATESRYENQGARYLRGSGASEPATARSDRADANTPTKSVDGERYLRGSGISSGPTAVGK